MFGSTGAQDGSPAKGLEGSRMERIQYLRTDGGCSKFAIYECDEQGKEQFMERSFDDLEWVSFVPSDGEKLIARHIHKEANKERGCLRIHHEGDAVTIDWVR